MMESVRWGLLSTANINRRLIPAIKASTRGKLVAVASRNLEQAQAYAVKWEIPQAFGSYEAMLESGKIDAVYISLPNHLHAEWSVRAMQAGIHVLCEKPLAISTDEVDRMIAASQQTGRLCAEAFMYRHHPQTKLAGEWVHSGRLGEIRLVRSVFNFYLGEPGNVRLVPEFGGGCLWDVGIYPISFSQFVFGELPQSAIGSQWIGDSGVDEFFSGQMHYAGDRVAQIASGFCSPFYSQAEILGTEGRLELNRPFIGMDEGRKMTFVPVRGEPFEIPVPERELYLGEVEDMDAAILDGTPLYISLLESRNHVRTAVALYESANSGKMIKL